MPDGWGRQSEPLAGHLIPLIRINPSSCSTPAWFVWAVGLYAGLVRAVS